MSGQINPAAVRAAVGLCTHFHQDAVVLHNFGGRTIAQAHSPERRSGLQRFSEKLTQAARTLARALKVGVGEVRAEKSFRAALKATDAGVIKLLGRLMTEKEPQVQDLLAEIQCAMEPMRPILGEELGGAFEARVNTNLDKMNSEGIAALKAGLEAAKKRSPSSREFLDTIERVATECERLLSPSSRTAGRTATAVTGALSESDSVARANSAGLGFDGTAKKLLAAQTPAAYEGGIAGFADDVRRFAELRKTELNATPQAQTATTMAKETAALEVSLHLDWMMANGNMDLSGLGVERLFDLQVALAGIDATAAAKGVRRAGFDESMVSLAKDATAKKRPATIGAQYGGLYAEAKIILHETRGLASPEKMESGPVNVYIKTSIQKLLDAGRLTPEDVKSLLAALPTEDFLSFVEADDISVVDSTKANVNKIAYAVYHDIFDAPARPVIGAFLDTTKRLLEDKRLPDREQLGAFVDNAVAVAGQYKTLERGAVAWNRTPRHNVAAGVTEKAMDAVQIRIGEVSSRLNELLANDNIDLSSLGVDRLRELRAALASLGAHDAAKSVERTIRFDQGAASIVREAAKAYGTAEVGKLFDKLYAEAENRFREASGLTTARKPDAGDVYAVVLASIQGLLTANRLSEMDVGQLLEKLPAKDLYGLKAAAPGGADAESQLNRLLDEAIVRFETVANRLLAAEPEGWNHNAGRLVDDVSDFAARFEHVSKAKSRTDDPAILVAELTANQVLVHLDNVLTKLGVDLSGLRIEQLLDLHAALVSLGANHAAASTLARINAATDPARFPTVVEDLSKRETLPGPADIERFVGDLAVVVRYRDAQSREHGQWVLDHRKVTHNEMNSITSAIGHVSANLNKMLAKDDAALSALPIDRLRDLHAALARLGATDAAAIVLAAIGPASFRVATERLLNPAAPIGHAAIGQFVDDALTAAGHLEAQRGRHDQWLRDPTVKGGVTDQQMNAINATVERVSENLNGMLAKPDVDLSTLDSYRLRDLYAALVTLGTTRAAKIVLAKIAPALPADAAGRLMSSAKRAGGKEIGQFVEDVAAVAGYLKVQRDRHDQWRRDPSVKEGVTDRQMNAVNGTLAPISENLNKILAKGGVDLGALGIDRLSDLHEALANLGTTAAARIVLAAIDTAKFATAAQDLSEIDALPGPEHIGRFADNLAVVARHLYAQSNNHHHWELTMGEEGGVTDRDMKEIQAKVATVLENLNKLLAQDGASLRDRPIDRLRDIHVSLVSLDAAAAAGIVHDAAEFPAARKRLLDLATPPGRDTIGRLTDDVILIARVLKADLDAAPHALTARMMANQTEALDLSLHLEGILAKDDSALSALPIERLRELRSALSSLHGATDAAKSLRAESYANARKLKDLMAQAQRTGIATAADAQVLMAQLARAQQWIDSMRESTQPEDTKLTADLRLLADDHLRILNRAADSAGPEGRLFPDNVEGEMPAEFNDWPALVQQQVKSVVLGQHKAAAQKALGATLDRITPAELKQPRRGRSTPLEGGQALRAIDRMAWELGRALKESAELRVALGSRLLFDEANSADKYFSDYVGALRLGKEDKKELRDRLGDVMAKTLPNGKTVVINERQYLGEGASGKAYAGTFRKGSPEEQQVVVKVLDPMDIGDSLARIDLTNELVMQGRLHDEPNIPRIVGVYFNDKDQPHIVMERVKGTDTQHFFENHAEELADPAERAKVALHAFVGSVRALDALARQTIIHRDVKPENVMLDENSLQARLIDFGTAGPASNEKINATPLYASPETVVAPQNLTAQSDVYSLGSTLYSLLGWTPWGDLEKPVFQIASNLRDRNRTPGDSDLVVTWESTPDKNEKIRKSTEKLWPEELKPVKALILACWNHNPADRPTPAQMLQASRGETVTPAAESQAGLKADKVGVLDVLKPDHTLRQDPEGILRRLIGAK